MFSVSLAKRPCHGPKTGTDALRAYLLRNAASAGAFVGLKPTRSRYHPAGSVTCVGKLKSTASRMRQVFVGKVAWKSGTAVGEILRSSINSSRSLSLVTPPEITSGG